MYQSEVETGPFPKNLALRAYASCNSRMTRRTVFKAAVGIAGAIVCDYGLSRIADTANMIPCAYGQSSGRIIDVGTEQYPIDFDSPTTLDEYDKDTIDYKYPASIVTSGKKTEGHLYVKRDSEFTKFIGDFPTSVSNPKGFSFKLIFDTENSNSQDTGAKGVYNLYLHSTSSGPPSEVSSVVGIPFSRDFHREEDYDWRYFLAPSPLSSTPHVQIKSEFKTDILLRSDNPSREILFYGSETDRNGILEFRLARN